ncbi:MAG: bifunctional [glutamine synthetase] adenylyltransferase/[glutamine synthetase]-adenylyl-L-tyrosine phosphorylase, partial [Methylobacteriaceae bacterium]|nr:bifunctional [glutamine synthetase] adenylyltransferase/[glutamine synthetase]-adenylyl-L-tyrosine phosphorylase [Methylobacteriaceae bacterium]
MIKLRIPRLNNEKDAQPLVADAPKERFVARVRSAPRLLSIKRVEQHYADLMQQAAAAGIEDTLASLLQDDIVHRLVFCLADHSPFLWQIIMKDPSHLVTILERVPETLAAEACGRQRDYALVVDDDDDTMGEVKRAMRRERTKYALLVALADLGGLWSLEEVTAALSEFADASVKGAVRAVLRDEAKRGRFAPADPADPEKECGVVVLALGKHGARELNYSSDIDLTVFFDATTTRVMGKAAEPFFYVKLAQTVSSLLQERTAEGYVHRVDYRLRPDPGSTPVAISLGSARVYYETMGQNWERAALVKARPVAGDIVLGERLLEELRPFIWRRYFDFASIADIHAMKRQIHAVRGYDEIVVPGHDVKLGRGGIREIEFFVQTQQLVFGGRCPRLRGSRTLDMLPQLEQEGWISGKARGELSDAYRFFRTVEHRLQMVADEQTQRLPSDSVLLERFARFCGFASLAAFARLFTRHAQNVCHHYALLFEDAGELSVQEGDLVFVGGSPDPETLVTLRNLGFREAEKAWETVSGWHFGRRPALISARAREVLTEIIPLLLRALGGSADPDAALGALDGAFARMPAAVELLTILQAHEKLRVLFADLLGSAPRLTEMVAQAPHVLDMVIDPTFAEPVLEEETIELVTGNMIGTPAYFEAFLDGMRDVARQLSFLTGARVLSGILPLARSGQVYSGLAQAMVRLALKAV